MFKCREVLGVFVYFMLTTDIWATTWQNQQNECVPSKDSDQPGHPPSLIRGCPDWSETSLCTQLVAKDPSFLHADSEDSDKTERMPRLVWVFAGRTLILLVLSWGGSFFSTIQPSDLYNAAVRVKIIEPRFDKTNKMSVRPAKTQVSLGIRPVWSESSLSAWRKLGSLATHCAHSE